MFMVFELRARLGSTNDAKTEIHVHVETQVILLE